MVPWCLQSSPPKGWLQHVWLGVSHTYSIAVFYADKCYIVLHVLYIFMNYSPIHSDFNDLSQEYIFGMLWIVVVPCYDLLLHDKELKDALNCKLITQYCLSFFSVILITTTTELLKFDIILLVMSCLIHFMKGKVLDSLSNVGKTFLNTGIKVGIVL